MHMYAHACMNFQTMYLYLYKCSQLLCTGTYTITDGVVIILLYLGTRFTGKIAFHTILTVLWIYFYKRGLSLNALLLPELIKVAKDCQNQLL